jgi:hypothetical protein
MSYGRYVVFQMAEVAIARQMFQERESRLIARGSMCMTGQRAENISMLVLRQTFP